MIQEQQILKKLQEHYAPPNLSETVLNALAAAGKDLNHLTIEDLAPLDQFHIRGQQATVELAAQLNLNGSETSLDVGSGLGGAARYLAATYGTHVTGLDLTEAYCETARVLSARLGLSDRVEFRQGSALNMPFEDETFDLVWTQHTQMNIADKPRLYREIYRVLKAGGRFAMYDVLAGSGGPVIFPVPWTHTPEFSSLIRPDDLRALLAETGFRSLHWQDKTTAGLTAFQNLVAKIHESGVPTLSFQVYLGPDFRLMAENIVRNLEENRIVVGEGVWVKD